MAKQHEKQSHLFRVFEYSSEDDKRLIKELIINKNTAGDHQTFNSITYTECRITSQCQQPAFNKKGTHIKIEF